MKYEELKALGRKLTSKYIKENIEYPLDMFGNSPIEKLYNVFFSGPHVCPVCGSPLKFISFAKGYQKFCSSKCSNNSEQTKSKAKQTCLEKYGVENPSQSPEIKQKIINSRRNHTLSTHPEIESSTGTEWVCTCPHQECDKCTEKTYVTHASIHYDRSRYGFELCTKLHPISDTKRSSLELKICDWLDEHRVDHETNNRTLIAPRELDIYIPSRELAIECNGVYWHSVNEKPKKYHMNKYNACKEIGVKLISIWEDEDINTMMNLIAYHLGFDYDECLLNQLDCNLVDYGLGKGEIIPHMMIRDGYECWDSGIFV